MADFSNFYTLAPSSELNCKLRASTSLPRDSPDQDGQRLSLAFFATMYGFWARAQKLFRPVFRENKLSPTHKFAGIGVTLLDSDHAECFFVTVPE